MQSLLRNYVYPIVTLSGGIIGVGFLALPYLALSVGFWPMILYVIAFSALVLAIHVILGHICIKTPDFKRWPGFVEFYFGKPAKMFIMPLIVLGIFGVMLVYIIVGGQFLSALFGPGPVLYPVLYWLAASAFIFFGVRAISKFDLLVIILLLCSLAVIFVKGWAHLSLGNLPAALPFSTSSALSVYGAILFSLWGTGLIPEVEEMVRDRKKSLTRIIALGTLIPVGIYLVFIVLVLSITGLSTTESALVGIRQVLGDGIISLALLIGVMTTFVAFIAQGLLLKKIFIYDGRVPELSAFIITCAVPMVFFLIGVRAFIPIISLIGGLLLGVEGILILLIYRKIGGKPIVVYPLMLVFIVGILYSMLYSSF